MARSFTVAALISLSATAQAAWLASSGRAVVRSPVGAARAARAVMISDDELFASLKQRLSQSQEKTRDGAPPPLGPDDVGADSMGPTDVVEYIMQSLVALQSAGQGEACKVLMSFAVKVREGKAEDFVGQLQPGYFSDPQTLENYLSSQPRYETLTRMEEYKCMGTPDFSEMSRKAVQKLLVRRPGKNWEDLMINMQLVEVDASGATPPATAGGPPKSRRWLITSIYKQGTP